jgi:hypothetical protein
VTRTAFTWNIGKPQSTTLPGPIASPSAAERLHALATSFACVRIASFGSPVVPPVANHDEGSSGEMIRPLASADGSSAAIEEAKSWRATCLGARSTAPRASTSGPVAVGTSTRCFSEDLRASASRSRCQGSLPRTGASVTRISAPDASSSEPRAAPASLGFSGIAIPAASPPHRAKWVSGRFGSARAMTVSFVAPRRWKRFAACVMRPRRARYVHVSGRWPSSTVRKKVRALPSGSSSAPRRIAS